MVVDGAADALLRLLFPHWSQVRVSGVTASRMTVRFEVAAASPIAVCPLCDVASMRVHSRYRRRLTDHAVGGRAVEIRAFSPDVHVALAGSVELAMELGVASDEILDSDEKLDAYFLD